MSCCHYFFLFSIFNVRSCTDSSIWSAWNYSWIDIGTFLFLYSQDIVFFKPYLYFWYQSISLLNYWKHVTYHWKNFNNLPLKNQFISIEPNNITFSHNILVILKCVTQNITRFFWFSKSILSTFQISIIISYIIFK